MRAIHRNVVLIGSRRSLGSSLAICHLTSGIGRTLKPLPCRILIEHIDRLDRIVLALTQKVQLFMAQLLPTVRSSLRMLVADDGGRPVSAAKQQALNS